MKRYPSSVEANAPKSPPNVRRERVRAATVQEIKTTALRLMAASGSADVTFSEVARAMDMTAPALYRYFASRDDLLATLVADGYANLADRLASEQDTVAATDLTARLAAVFRGYRSWARDNPVWFSLVVGPPVRCAAPAQDTAIGISASRAMGNLEGIVVAAAEQGLLSTPEMAGASPTFEAVVPTARATDDGPLPTAAYQAMVHSWLSLHGFVALDTFGHLDWLPTQGREALFEAEIERACVTIGLQRPPPALISNAL